MQFVTERDKGGGGLKSWHFLRHIIFEWPLLMLDNKQSER